MKLAALAIAALLAATTPPNDVDVTRLQALIRNAAVNPPGGEERNARLVASWLEAEGVPAKVYVSAPGRANVIARLQAGPTPQPVGAVMLLGHLDVVPAEAERWHQPPFAANIVDGKLWGRGSLDMLDLDVMELHAFLALAHRHAKLAHDVIYCGVADEEAGGDFGAKWMIEHHGVEVACSELLNEGGSGLTLPRHDMMGIQTAERGSLWVRVTAHGTPGHGSQDRPDSAPRRLLRALARLEAHPREYELGPETGPMVRAIGAAQSPTAGLVMDLLSLPFLTPLLAPVVVAKQPFFGPLLTTTWNPDVIATGRKVNVVPGEASAELDIRMLPGHTSEGTLAWLKGILAEDSLTYEIMNAAEPSRSPADGRLFACLSDAVKAQYPGVQVAPIMTPGGGTDSAWFRPLGVRCYGCAPILTSPEQIAAIHGDDEYITLDQLARGTEVVTTAVTRFATTP